MGSAASNIEGRLDIRIRRAGDRVQEVNIESSRPLQTPQIFVGKPVEQVLSTLPLLYSVCGTAQAYAAVTACEQALGNNADAQQQQAREQLVWLETAKEHLWRVLIDWPGLLGQAPSAEGVSEVMRLIQAYRRVRFPSERPFVPGARATGPEDPQALREQLTLLLRREVFGVSPLEWSRMEGVDRLLVWLEEAETPAAAMLRSIHSRGWSGLGANPVEALPELSAEGLQQALSRPGADAYIAEPDLEGVCYETSPFTRMADNRLLDELRAKFGNGLLTRFTARLMELATIPRRLEESAHVSSDSRSVDIPPAIGIAQVEAARGRLVHRVVLDGERVAQYQILAPTEWNFHPRGVLAQGLMGLSGHNEAVLREQAGLLINAIDPCVGYELYLTEA